MKEWARIRFTSGRSTPQTLLHLHSIILPLANGQKRWAAGQVQVTMTPKSQWWCIFLATGMKSGLNFGYKVDNSCLHRMIFENALNIWIKGCNFYRWYFAIIQQRFFFKKKQPSWVFHLLLFFLNVSENGESLYPISNKFCKWLLTSLLLLTSPHS